MSIAGVRRWHSYIGLFIAPSVLFFALTGAAQLFSLHEAHGNYHPFALVEKLSSVHKDQVFELGRHEAAPEPEADTGKPAAADAAHPAGAQEDEDKTELSTLLLKGFLLFVALCLTLSTALGLWMGLRQTRPKRLAWLLVIAGLVIPLGLLVF